MKKQIALALAALAMVSLCACGAPESQTEEATKETTEIVTEAPKTYFAEDPTLMTPDCVIDGVSLAEKKDKTYYYKIADSDIEAKTAIADWMKYLGNHGMTYEMVSDTSIVVEKDNRTYAFVVVGHLDYGYVMCWKFN